MGVAGKGATWVSYKSFQVLRSTSVPQMLVNQGIFVHFS